MNYLFSIYVNEAYINLWIMNNTIGFLINILIHFSFFLLLASKFISCFGYGLVTQCFDSICISIQASYITTWHIWASSCGFGYLLMFCGLYEFTVSYFLLQNFTVITYVHKTNYCPQGTMKSSSVILKFPLEQFAIKISCYTFRFNKNSSNKVPRGQFTTKIA